MSNPNGEPCYTAEEVENLINQERKQMVLNELHRILLQARELPRYEVMRLIGEVMDKPIDPKDPEELDRLNYPNGFISSKEQQTNEPGYPYKH